MTDKYPYTENDLIRACCLMLGEKNVAHLSQNGKQPNEITKLAAVECFKVQKEWENSADFEFLKAQEILRSAIMDLIPDHIFPRIKKVEQ